MSIPHPHPSKRGDTLSDTKVSEFRTISVAIDHHENVPELLDLVLCKLGGAAVLWIMGIRRLAWGYDGDMMGI